MKNLIYIVCLFIVINCSSPKRVELSPQDLNKYKSEYSQISQEMCLSEIDNCLQQNLSSNFKPVRFSKDLASVWDASRVCKTDVNSCKQRICEMPKDDLRGMASSLNIREIMQSCKSETENALQKKISDYEIKLIETEMSFILPKKYQSFEDFLSKKKRIMICFNNEEYKKSIDIVQAKLAIKQVEYEIFLRDWDLVAMGGNVKRNVCIAPGKDLGKFGLTNNDVNIINL